MVFLFKNTSAESLGYIMHKGSYPKQVPPFSVNKIALRGLKQEKMRLAAAAAAEHKTLSFVQIKE